MTKELLQQALVSNAVAYRYRFKNDLQWQYTESLAQATQPCEIQYLYIAQPTPAMPNLPNHPESNTFTWSDFELQTIAAYGKKCFDAGKTQPVQPAAIRQGGDV